MNEGDIIKEIMKQKKVTYRDLADRCGFSSPSGVSMAVTRKHGMRTDVLNKLATAMGCEIIIRDTVSGDEYKII